MLGSAAVTVSEARFFANHCCIKRDLTVCKLAHYQSVKLTKNPQCIRHLSAISCLSVRNEDMEKEEEQKTLVGDADGVIIVDHGSRRKESNLMLNDFVGMFVARNGYRIVEPAHMELAEPSIKDAFDSCVQRGATRIIISPFFLLPGKHWSKDIPALAAEAAKAHPGISYVITAPLGLHELLVDVMNDRIQQCLMHVSGDADECSVCAGTGRCRLYTSEI
ncbi:Sirohydrochlorin cobaltochelatase [Zostera marina]|uniref:Sirohydrochlorin cobaltochelatase n=1 Tax=Zostera marina TaxID=29655 RepID=A0A0K9P7T7_ZOSMR|nr:Sirohydrochlorin cobaltochelatase [Zostera marina]